MPCHHKIWAEALSRPMTERNQPVHGTPATPRRLSNPAHQAIVTKLVHEEVMRATQLHEAKTARSALVEWAAKGDTAIISRRGQLRWNSLSSEQGAMRSVSAQASRSSLSSRCRSPSCAPVTVSSDDSVGSSKRDGSGAVRSSPAGRPGV